MTIIDAMNDAALFRRWFRSETWDRWRIALKVLFALPLNARELAVFREHTARHEPPREPAHEAWFVVGRRGGKSIVAALVAVFLACFVTYPQLAPGEVGTVMILAADRKQARTLLRYVRGFLTRVPMLRKMIVAETKESIELSNNIVIEVHTSNYRSVRGYTAVAIICDEAAFWPVDVDTATSDLETVNSLRPALLTTGGLLLGISSPHARRGILWEQYRRYHGVEHSPVLTWQASSMQMNPTLPARIIEDALAEDPSRAAAEYLAQFRVDVEGYVTRETLERITATGRTELPPITGKQRAGHVDAAGGSGKDPMTMSIVHDEQDKVVQDIALERRPPFSPKSVTREFAKVLKQYGLSTAYADRYAADWVTEAFATEGITLQRAEKSASELYIEFLHIANSGQVELLDLPRMQAQFLNLERKATSSGRELVTHPTGQHDDLANATAGAVVAANAMRQRGVFAPPILTGTRPNPFSLDRPSDISLFN